MHILCCTIFTEPTDCRESQTSRKRRSSRIYFLELGTCDLNVVRVDTFIYRSSPFIIWGMRGMTEHRLAWWHPLYSSTTAKGLKEQQQRTFWCIKENAKYTARISGFGDHSILHLDAKTCVSLPIETLCSACEATSMCVCAIFIKQHRV